MATKNNRRVLVTKKILKESLLTLMKEKPISKISIKEICDLSEMSRSTFYLHYQDQYELLTDIENTVLENTYEALDDLKDDLNTIDSIEKFLNYVKSNKETFGVLLCQQNTEDFQNAIVNKIGQLVQESIDDFPDTLENNYLIVFIMQGCLQVIRTWIQKDFDLSVPELSRLIFKMCSYRIAFPIQPWQQY